MARRERIVRDARAAIAGCTRSRTPLRVSLTLDGPCVDIDQCPIVWTEGVTVFLQFGVDLFLQRQRIDLLQESLCSFARASQIEDVGFSGDLNNLRRFSDV
jgi:hypothetical protein